MAEMLRGIAVAGVPARGGNLVHGHAPLGSDVLRHITGGPFRPSLQVAFSIDGGLLTTSLRVLHATGEVSVECVETGPRLARLALEPCSVKLKRIHASFR